MNFWCIVDDNQYPELQNRFYKLKIYDHKKIVKFTPPYTMGQLDTDISNHRQFRNKHLAHFGHEVSKMYFSL